MSLTWQKPSISLFLDWCQIQETNASSDADPPSFSPTVALSFEHNTVSKRPNPKIQLTLAVVYRTTIECHKFRPLCTLIDDNAVSWWKQLRGLAQLCGLALLSSAVKDWHFCWGSKGDTSDSRHHYWHYYLFGPKKNACKIWFNSHHISQNICDYFMLFQLAPSSLEFPSRLQIWKNEWHHLFRFGRRCVCGAPNFVAFIGETGRAA